MKKDYIKLICDELAELGLETKCFARNDTRVFVNEVPRKLTVRCDRILYRSKELLFDDPIPATDSQKAAMHSDDIVCFVDKKNGIGYLVNWKKLFPHLRTGGDDDHNKLPVRRVSRSDNYPQDGWAIPIGFLRENDYIFRCLILDDVMAEKEKSAPC